MFFFTLSIGIMCKYIKKSTIYIHFFLNSTRKNVWKTIIFNFYYFSFTQMNVDTILILVGWVDVV